MKRFISKQLYTYILQNGEYVTPWLHYYREIDDDGHEIVLCEEIPHNAERVYVRTKGIDYE